jgi:hypothetical protein
VLKFNGKWRFTPPPDDDTWNNQTIPHSALDDFYDLVAKTATQGNRQRILEHFKGAFCTAIGTQHVWSSSESWSEADLRDYMERATSNAPLFIEAFYDACISLIKISPELFAPDIEIINNLCLKHKIGYEIHPPDLILRNTILPEIDIDSLKTAFSKIDYSDHSNIVINYINTETAHSLTQGNRKLNSHNLKVFLCHSSGDKPTVRNLYHQLKKDGFISWFDEESLLPGQDWQLEIPKAVRNSDIVIVCLSKSSITKAGYIQKEIKQALDVADEQPEGTIFIIPLRLEECDVPERLQKWHWVNFFEESGYQRLVRSLNKRIEEKDLR